MVTEVCPSPASPDTIAALSVTPLRLRRRESFPDNALRDVVPVACKTGTPRRVTISDELTLAPPQCRCGLVVNTPPCFIATVNQQLDPIASLSPSTRKVGQLARVHHWILLLSCLGQFVDAQMCY